ncbi:gamma-aminobutyric acid type B receptor subunit 1-like [Acanthaster planci]|uniref:Gamma-aminobutyric acid type B receptor subunit 2 n=1 Tax=Acanthaster planci TaxID=133434 RepID=A0A8B7YKJ0_ACAPL|nr:gamma-aminobutyric acid type B receptor subunit 1-like [Acanthaster planci]
MKMDALHQQLLFTTSLIFLSLTTETLCLTNITLGGLFSFGGAGTDWDGSAILQSTLLALQHVNEDPSVLPGYYLKLDVKNSKCRPGEGMKGFVDLINEEPTKLMLLGASCSVVSQPVAETAQHWNLVQMSASSTSDVLSYKERFPYFFRTNPAQSGLNTPRIAIMKEYGWERVAIIHESNDVYTNAMNKFSEELSLNNLSLVAKESFASGETPSAQLRNLKDKDARIIVSSAYTEGYKLMFCEAFRLEMYGPRYVWMIDSWNSLYWWKNVTHLGCSEQEMYQVVQHHVGTVFLNMRTDTERTASQLTASQYQDAYASYTNGHPYPGEDLAPFGYDSVWALALALHRVASDLAAENSSIRIEDFDYDNTHSLRERLVMALSNLEFEGITGFVTFDASGDRLAPFKIEQLLDGSEETVGLYLPEEGIQWTREQQLTFIEGIAPMDGPMRETLYIGIDAVTFVAFTVLAVIGMGGTVAFLIVNLIYRAERVIKMSCPNVNNVIAVGCFMCYVDVIVAGLNQNVVSQWVSNAACLAQVWILPISFSLAFGGLFAKTWRVHVIFRNKTKRTRIVDYHLFVIIGVVVAIDVVIISVWTGHDPSRLVRTSLPEQVDTAADKITIRMVDKCDSPESPRFLWIGIIFCWKGILLMFGAFLAWETRKVTIPQLNDSKYIAVAIYNVAVPSIIVAPLVTFISTDLPGVSYILTASCILFGTTVTNSLIFIPKIVALRQGKSNSNSQDQHPFSVHNQVGPALERLATCSSSVDDSTIREKEKEIKDLKNKLKRKDEEIERIKEVLDRTDHGQGTRPEG